MNEVDKLIALVRETSPELLKQSAGASAAAAMCLSVILFLLLLMPLYVFIKALRDKDGMEIGLITGGISAFLTLCLLISVSDTVIRFLYPAPAAIRYLLR